MAKARLLLVEDNPRIQLANKDMLELLGYEVSLAMNLSEARACIIDKAPDVVVLDVMLPDGSGLDFLQELHQESNAPVLMLTALGSTEDTVRGLSLGADDYLAKPYAYAVLAARVEALLRRAIQIPEKLIRDRLSLDVAAGVAMLDGTDLLLTQKEFALLLIFIQNEENFISSEYLYEKAWKQPMAGNSQALKKTIFNLRKKIENSGWHIEWSRGEGYCFERE